MEGVEKLVVAGSARALPDDEWRARALAGLALALEGHREAVARAGAGARATDPDAAIGEYRAAVFCAPLLAENSSQPEVELGFCSA